MGDDVVAATGGILSLDDAGDGEWDAAVAAV